MKGKIAALIVTYNRKGLLLECLDALKKQTYTELDIYVIDNASTDGTKEALRKYIENNDIVYINTQKNLGGAGGFNYGIRKIAVLDYEYIWIMDDDTIPKEDALEKFIDALAVLPDTVGFLASSVLCTDGNFCRMNNPGILRETLLEQDYTYVQKGICKIEYASFVSILVSVKAVRQCGLPIKDFFIWKDDYEYTTRISSKYPCYYVSKSEVIHKIKNNMLPDISTDDKDRIDRYFYEYRNGYYVVRNAGLRNKAFYYVKTLKSISRVLRGKEKYKGKRIKVIFKGIISGWFFKPSVEYVEKEQKSSEVYIG